MPELSAIMLAHNKCKYTRHALESLTNTSDVNLEMIVVDNGSTDSTPEMLADMQNTFEAAGHRLVCIRNDDNAGCCTARNRGLEAARSPYCAFLDNDVMAVEPDWAARLIRSLESGERRAIVGPKMIYPFQPHWIQCAGVGISPSGRVQFRGRGQERDLPEYNHRKEVQCLISACFLFRRSLYEQIGGLNELFNPIEFEDFDFCYRARAMGWRCIYEPAVEMYHWESITSEGTRQLPNTRLIIEHGMQFKNRWEHMFRYEDGPPDSECQWEPITMPGLEGERTR
ncbi:MAG: glycosyltransferase family 2 protein [Planctomycetota bacterium]